MSASRREIEVGRVPGHAFRAEEMREIGGHIADLVRKGCYLSVACKMVGVSREVFYRWRRVAHGEDTAEDSVRPEYRAVCEEVVTQIEQALAEMEGYVVREWMKEIPGNWQAARDFLARRFPQRWANSEHRALQVTTAGQMELQLRWGDEPDDDPAREGETRDLILKERD